MKGWSCLRSGMCNRSRMDTCAILYVSFLQPISLNLPVCSCCCWVVSYAATLVWWTVLWVSSQDLRWIALCLFHLGTIFLINCQKYISFSFGEFLYLVLLKVWNIVWWSGEAVAACRAFCPGIWPSGGRQALYDVTLWGWLWKDWEPTDVANPNTCNLVVLATRKCKGVSSLSVSLSPV